jgi:BirA family biotin operon repressor/biotin-[acetyl-CoA-carboxylase] ligase
VLDLQLQIYDLKLRTSAPIHFLPVRLVSFESLPSTNDYLKNLSLNGNVEEGTVILAMNQTRGRGQMDRVWNSEPGKNITLSLFLKPVNLSASGAFVLSKAIALSVYETIARYATDVSIKWPNDILVKGKKIAGILIENTISGDQVKTSIAGIGINVNQVTFDNPQATSLALECEETFDVIDIVHTLIREIKVQYHLLVNEEYDELNQSYFERLYRGGQENTFSINGIESPYTIRDIEPDGRIMLQSGGEEKAYYYGEARWILS